MPNYVTHFYWTEQLTFDLRDTRPLVPYTLLFRPIQFWLATPIGFGVNLHGRRFLRMGCHVRSTTRREGENNSHDSAMHSQDTTALESLARPDHSM